MAAKAGLRRHDVVEPVTSLNFGPLALSRRGSDRQADVLPAEAE